MDVGGRPLCFLLARAEALFVAEFDARLADAGYSDLALAHTANVLRFLQDEGLRPGQLVERACVTKQAVSQQVAHLQRCGYVTVEPDPRDNRARQVQLTPRGRRAQQVASRLFAEIEQDWSLRIGSKDFGALRRSLERALPRLSAASEPEAPRPVATR